MSALAITAGALGAVALAAGVAACARPGRFGVAAGALAGLAAFAALEVWLAYAGSERQDLAGLLILTALGGAAASAAYSALQGGNDGKKAPAPTKPDQD